MAIVITNGKHYITYTDSGAVKKTTEINDAYQFLNVSKAIKGMKKAKKKTQNYFVFDTLTQQILWEWITEDKIILVQKEKVSQSKIERRPNGKIKRKRYSKNVRELIYNKAGGCCELCGRKLLLENMTLDHKIPLSMGGIDCVDNLACVCYADNQLKNNILPTDFMERIRDIFLYQMEKQYKGKFRWKIVHRILNKMV